MTGLVGVPKNHIFLQNLLYFCLLTSYTLLVDLASALCLNLCILALKCPKDLVGGMWPACLPQGVF